MRSASELIEEAVDQFASLPGIGRKTALRLVLDLLDRSQEDVEAFSKAFVELKKNITYCEKCHNISDDRLCKVCRDQERDGSVICVVQGSNDVMAIEGSQQFNGKYHVLGGVISPMDGTGPGDLNVDPLLERVDEEGVQEVILALSTTMEGDTTNHFLYKKLQPKGVKVSTIARGVSIGNELEYTDEVTLGRSIVNRTPYEDSLSR